MHLIIDGYNLLGAIGRLFGPEGTERETARESLLRELAAYRQRKRHPLTVVFDGWQQGQATEGREHRAGVQIIYSRRGEKADQVIQRLVREFGSDCAVVSSDHEIMATGRAQGAFIMGAQEFAEKLQWTGRFPGPAHKELDPGDDLTRRDSKKGNPRKLPKSARQRARRLKRF